MLVASDLALPGAGRAEAAHARADVTIRAARVPPRLETPTRTGPNWAMAPGAFLLEVPGLVRFHLEDGRTIAYAAEPAAAPDDVAAFLMGGAFGLLLHLRGLVVLNASSVLVDGRAVLFIGGSGVGKSTLAAVLEARGYPAIADDLCAVGAGPDGRPRVLGDGAELKLWDEAIDVLGLGARRGTPVRPALRKFHLGRREALVQAPRPVGAVYAVREARAPFAPGVTRPNVVDANLLVRRSAYRPPMVDMLDHAPAYFAAAAAFGNGAGVFLLHLAADFEALAETLDGLERGWSGADSLAGAA